MANTEQGMNDVDVAADEPFDDEPGPDAELGGEGADEEKEAEVAAEAIDAAEAEKEPD